VSIHPFSHFLSFAYLAEAGFVLLVVPWTQFWERNYFVESGALLSGVLQNHFVRGGISGVGLVCLACALLELRSLARVAFTRTPRP
jgi:hypothetical protein